MPPKANIGVLIPKAFAGPMPEPREFTEFFQAVEAMGFHSLWTTERIFHQVNILDSLTALTWAASVTTRVKLGSSVVLSNLRHPLILARAVAGLDYMSGGRFILGLGVGGHPEEFEAVGVPIRQRPSRLEETIAILRQVWSQPDASFQGRRFNLKGVTVAPRPVSGKGIPILLGGAADAVLRRTVAMADGWIASSSVVPEQLRERRQTLLRMAEEAGRDAASLEIGKLLYMAIDDDTEKARTRVGSAMHSYYGSGFDVDSFCAFGPPEACARGIQPYLDSGVTTLMLGFA